MDGKTSRQLDGGFRESFAAFVQSERAMSGAIGDLVANMLHGLGIGVELLHAHAFKAAAVGDDAVVELDIRFAGAEFVDFKTGRGFAGHV